MRIYLGGHLSFFHPQQKRWLEISIEGPKALSEILDQAGIPREEVHLVSINGGAVDLKDAVVSPADNVRLYSPVGGG